MQTTGPLLSRNPTYLKARRLVVQSYRMPTTGLDQLRKYLKQDRSILRYDLAHICVETNNVAALQVMHECGDKFTSLVRGDTPLTHSINQDRVDCVRYFVSVGLRVESSHMVKSVQLGDPEVLSVLIQSGGDVNAPYEYIDPDNGQRMKAYPLYDAVIKGMKYLVPTLLEAKADLTVRNQNLNTPMHGAAAWGDVDICQMLFKAGAPCDLYNVMGFTPLMQAVIGNQSHLVPLFVHQFGVSVDQRIPSDQKKQFAGCTALHVCCMSPSSGVQAIEALVEAGADVNAAKAPGGDLPRDVAHATGFRHMDQCLLRLGGKVQRRKWADVEESDEQRKRTATARKEAGKRAFAAGDLQSAQRHFLQAIIADADDVTLPGNLSLISLKAGNASEAALWGHKCVRMDSSWSKGYVRVAEAYSQMSRLDEAFDALHAGLKMCPTDLLIHNEFSHLAIKRAALRQKKECYDMFEVFGRDDKTAKERAELFLRRSMAIVFEQAQVDGIWVTSLVDAPAKMIKVTRRPLKEGQAKWIAFMKQRLANMSRPSGGFAPLEDTMWFDLSMSLPTAPIHFYFVLGKDKGQGIGLHCNTTHDLEELARVYNYYPEEDPVAFPDSSIITTCPMCCGNRHKEGVVSLEVVNRLQVSRDALQDVKDPAKNYEKQLRIHQSVRVWPRVWCLRCVDFLMSTIHEEVLPELPRDADNKPSISAPMQKPWPSVSHVSQSHLRDIKEKLRVQYMDFHNQQLAQAGEENKSRQRHSNEEPQVYKPKAPALG